MGGSIEDYDPEDRRLYEIDHGAERIAAASEVAHALLNGACLVLAPSARTAGPELVSFLREERVTVATMPPSLLAALPDEALPALASAVADTFKERTLAVVMTGMGSDGVLGAAHIKAQGGRVITEAEESCVVYGMPRAVVEAALSDRSAALPQLADVLLELV